MNKMAYYEEVEMGMEIVKGYYSSFVELLFLDQMKQMARACIIWMDVSDASFSNIMRIYPTGAIFIIFNF